MATHKTKSYDIDAWQFTGDLKKLPAWAKDKVKETKDEVFVTLPDGSDLLIESEWWIVKDHHDNIITMPAAAFENNYEPVASKSK
jgi:hypothetical protein